MSASRSPVDVPRLSLGTFPTEVSRLSALEARGTTFWVKHDDACGTIYGGNKVRKLEPILAGARARGKSRLVTLGASGSHHVLATTLYGREHGFSVAAVLVPQPHTTHAETNLRVALAAGLEVVPASSYAKIPVALLTLHRDDVAFVPLGGSSDLGTLGYVLAGYELAGQIARGELPEPDVVVAPLGSGGTVAGLAVGFEAAGLRTKIVGVCVSSPAPMFGAMMRRLVKRAAHRVLRDPNGARAAIARVDVLGTEVGGGYGVATPAGDRATRLAAEQGIALDPTYTAKAFSAALGEVSKGHARTVLFWHTLSSVSLDERVERAAPLPEALRMLFS